MTAGREGTGQMREGQDSVEFAAVYLQALWLHNFRGLEECTVEFEPDLTVLVGRNNSGKSRILRAIAVALGARALAQGEAVRTTGTTPCGYV
jgi:recombinational DNA repair ATPase RecF